MLPFFGKPLEALNQRQRITIGFGEKGFGLNYFDNQYPLSVPAYHKLLKTGSSQGNSGKVSIHF